MAILGHLELVQRSLPTGSKARRLLDGAVQGAERGAMLTKRMLAFARRQELKPERVEVVELVANMADMRAEMTKLAEHVEAVEQLMRDVG